MADQITIDRAVLNQALEALCLWSAGHDGMDAVALNDLIHRLEAALAQAEPVQEQTRSQKLAAAGFVRRPSLWALQAREVLELIATPQRPDGTWNRDREACRQLAAEALGRYEDV